MEPWAASPPPCLGRERLRGCQLLPSSVTLAAPFTAPPGFLPALRSVAAAPASADEPRKDFEAFASPDRGLVAVRGFPRPASAAPPGDALLPAVCALRPSAAADARRAVVP